MAGGKKAVLTPALPSRAPTRRCLRGSLGTELGSGRPSLGSELLLPGAVVGATKRKIHPCEGRRPSVRCWGGAGSGVGAVRASTGTGVPHRVGGRALHRRGSRCGVGARPRDGMGCASSPGNQADVDSLGFLSAAQIGASLSQQTQSVTVTAERCLRDAVDVQGMDCSHLSGERRARLCRGGGEGGRAAPRRSSPSFLCRAPGWWCGALVPGWQPGQSRRAAAGSSAAGWSPRERRHCELRAPSETSLGVHPRSFVCPLSSLLPRGGRRSGRREGGTKALPVWRMEKEKIKKEKGKKKGKGKKGNVSAPRVLLRPAPCLAPAVALQPPPLPERVSPGKCGLLLSAGVPVPYGNAN